MTPRRLTTAEASAVYDRVAAVSGIALDSLLSERQTAPICRARYLVMRLLRDMGASLPEVGRVMQLHHTTVLNGLMRFEEAVDEEPAFARLVAGVRLNQRNAATQGSVR